MQLALAPMEGLVDALLRELITEAGGVDWCVTEFIRVNDRLLPERVFHRLAPELVRAALTPSGTPVRVQLLGSDPACLADNAALACTLGAPAIDLNFGCPAKTVNRSRGGAILLREPELLHAILRAVRAAVPPEIPVTAKMRLGVEAPDIALECARALVDGGAETLVVHARTKLQGYKPPAHWEWVARIAEAVPVPVYANGEIWTVEDWQRCRAVSGVEDFMLGRGLVARPDLARQIAAVAGGQSPNPWVWQDVVPLLARFWARIRGLTPSGYEHGRLKQWLLWLSRSYPEAGGLFTQLRRETDVAQIDRALAEALNPVAFAA